MLAIGNEELGAPIGKTAKCPKCGRNHKVRFGKQEIEPGVWIETNMLCVVKCGKSDYLVGIAGKEYNRRGILGKE